MRVLARAVLGPGRRMSAAERRTSRIPGSGARVPRGRRPFHNPVIHAPFSDGPPRRIRVTQFLRAAAQPTAGESSSRHGRVPMESHMDTECRARIAGGSRRGDFPHRRASARIGGPRSRPAPARSRPDPLLRFAPARGRGGTGPDPPRIHEIYKRPARRSGRARRRDHAPGEGPGVPQGPAARRERGRPCPPWSAEPWSAERGAPRRALPSARRSGAAAHTGRAIDTHDPRVAH